MKNYKRYKFVKTLKLEDGEIPAGSEITILNDVVYFNGGMVQPYFRNLFLDLLEFEMVKGFNYLREIPIPYNKL